MAGTDHIRIIVVPQVVQGGSAGSFVSSTKLHVSHLKSYIGILIRTPSRHRSHHL